MKNISVEYAHIYTNSEIEKEHQIALKKIQPYVNNSDNSLVVMIDDYSFPDPTFDYDAFGSWLSDNNASPNIIIRESQLIPYCDITLSLIQDNNLKKDLINYIKKGKYPCSLFIATWYLIRLGCINAEIFPSSEVSQYLLNILPKSFEEYEEKGLDIIRATQYADKVDNIVYEFIIGRDI